MMTMMFDQTMRMCITTNDGKVHVLDVQAFTVEGTPRKAAGVAALKPAAEPKSSKLYNPADRSDVEIKGVLRGTATATRHRDERRGSM